MKAVVLEVQGGEAIVLTEEGLTRKIKYDGLCGDEIDLSEEKKIVPMRTRRAAGAFAAAVAVSVIAAGSYSYTTLQPCSYVTMDVNPSFEYSLNRRDQVISVEALNADAEDIVSLMEENHVKGMTIAEAIGLTTDLLENAGYLDTDREILVTVAGKDDARVGRLSDEVTALVDEIDQKNEQEITLDVMTASLEEREEARSSGISTGRYLESKGDSKKDQQEDETEKEEKTAKDSKPAGALASNSAAVPAGNAGGTVSAEDEAAKLYAMQQSLKQQNSSQQTSSDTVPAYTGSGSSAKKKTDVAVSSQALAAGPAGAEGQEASTEVPAAEPPALTPEEIAAAAAEAERNAILQAELERIAQQEAAAKIAAEQEAAQAAASSISTETSVDSSAVNTAPVPEDPISENPGVPLE